MADMLLRPLALRRRASPRQLSPRAGTPAASDSGCEKHFDDGSLDDKKRPNKDNTRTKQQEQTKITTANSLDKS